MRAAFYVALGFLIFSTSVRSATENYSTATKQSDTPVWMTVFVHGAIKAEWVLNSVLKVLQDSLEGSTYQKAISVARNDPHFFRFHAMQEQGLKKIIVPKGEAGIGASAIAHIYDQITAYAHQTPTINYYYTFGWSGLMSLTQRMEDAQHFYNELVSEIKKIHEHHLVMPRIRLISYSHGGNVCLNLAHAKDKNQSACLSIDELILIGSPVQRETKHLVADPMFKKIYNFYSLDDMVQPLDVFTSKNSRRTFKPTKTFELPSKLKQINVRVVHYKPRHEYRKKVTVPQPLPLDYEKNKIKKEEISPGHTELWYMGWTASMYRKNFPLYPLPIVDFVSLITAQIEHDQDFKNNVTVTIYPQQEVMSIKDKSGLKKTVPFIPSPLLTKLNAVAETYKPDAEYYKEYQKRIEEVLTFARASKNGGLVRVQKADGSYYKITKASMCLH